LRTAIIAIHQLPAIPETLWLRMLGKGRVQQRAINELMALPVENPLRASSLGLLYNLQAHLAASQQAEVNEEDRELIWH
jgi:hypothetical protein